MVEVQGLLLMLSHHAQAIVADSLASAGRPGQLFAVARSFASRPIRSLCVHEFEFQE